MLAYCSFTYFWPIVLQDSCQLEFEKVRQVQDFLVLWEFHSYEVAFAEAGRAIVSSPIYGCGPCHYVKVAQNAGTNQIVSYKQRLGVGQSLGCFNEGHLCVDATDNYAIKKNIV